MSSFCNWEELTVLPAKGEPLGEAGGTLDDFGEVDPPPSRGALDALDVDAALEAFDFGLIDSICPRFEVLFAFPVRASPAPALAKVPVLWLPLGVSSAGGPIEMTRLGATLVLAGFVSVASGVSQSESISALTLSLGGDDARAARLAPALPFESAPNSPDFGRSSPPVASPEVVRPRLMVSLSRRATLPTGFPCRQPDGAAQNRPPSALSLTDNLCTSWRSKRKFSLLDLRVDRWI